jgi:hypothetical protein
VICRRTAEVITQSLDGPLPLRARVGLRVHTFFCSPCRRFHRQMLHLHEAFVATVPADGGDLPTAGGLSTAARERIAAALNRAEEQA